MSEDSVVFPQAAIRDLLKRYAVESVRRVRGGLSASQVYHCQSAAAEFCLRRWPKGLHDMQSLSNIHTAIQGAHASGLDFLPRYLSVADPQSPIISGPITSPSDTILRIDGYFWEITDWSPGQPNYAQTASVPKLQSAMYALSKLHLYWQRDSHSAISPAMSTRIDMLSDLLLPSTGSFWLSAVRTEEERQLVSDTLAALVQWGPPLTRRLRELAAAPVSVHFVLRDIWSDHVLFTEDEVTGVIDFGAARIDEPATDVSRLLGSLEPFDLEAYEFGLASYQRNNPSVDAARIRTLDHASCLLSAAQWAKWLVVERRTFPAPRSDLLIRWKHFLQRLSNRDWQQ